MKSNHPLGRAVAAAALCAAIAAPAFAHHSLAMFDMGHEKTIAGTVSEFQWGNPHNWIWVEVPLAAGGSEKWGVETMSPTFMEHRGWTKKTLSVGDKVTLVIHPNRDGGRGGSFVSINLPDGRTLDMSSPLGSSATAKPSALSSVGAARR